LRHGDLSNAPVPRIVIAFEGIVGILPEERRKDYSKFVAKDKWWQAVAQFDINEQAVGKIIHLCLRNNMNISLCTWMSQDAAIAISEVMDFMAVPVRGCFYDSPYLLAQRLPYNEDIVCVYDSEPEHALIFGSKGKLLLDINQLGR
jgi:hypothetical protein